MHPFLPTYLGGTFFSFLDISERNFLERGGGGARAPSATPAYAPAYTFAYVSAHKPEAKEIYATEQQSILKLIVFTNFFLTGQGTSF